MSCGWEWRLLQAQLWEISYLPQSLHFIWNLEIAFWDILWNGTHFYDTMQSVLFTKTNVNMNVLLCNYLMELNFRCSSFWTILSSFSDDQRRYINMIEKGSWIIKWVIRHAHNNFGCIIIVANNPTATYFCWHSTKCERYLPQFALKYSHRHKDLIG